MSEEFKSVVNGQFIDTREDKPRFLETNSDDGLTFYRCCLCHRAVNLFELREHHACPHCGHARISPTNLTFWEKLVQIAKNPKVWEWKQQKNRI